MVYFLWVFKRVACLDVFVYCLVCLPDKLGCHVEILLLYESWYLLFFVFVYLYLPSIFMGFLMIMAIRYIVTFLCFDFHDIFLCSLMTCRSSRFARLQGIQCSMAGKNLYMRFTCSTGDAMGMNMVSKGVQNVLDFLLHEGFPDMEVVSLSG